MAVDVIDVLSDLFILRGTPTHIRSDNGIQFADIPKNRNGPTARFRGHPFDRTCWRHSIEHRLTKPKHP